MERDLELLRRQLFLFPRLAAAERLPARAKLGADALDPGLGALVLEGLERRAELLARVKPAAGPPEPLAERELRPRERPAIVGLFVEGEGLFERFLELVVGRK